MEPLSGLDASFLYLEDRSQPLHVCALFVLDTAGVPGCYDFPRFRAALHQRVRRRPEFRRLLRETPLRLARPAWRVQRDVEIERHVSRHVLAEPGGAAELAELCGELAGSLLERDVPLWELHVIEGLADDRVAVFAKFHHAVVDGVAAANLVVQLCDPAPDAEPPAETRSESGDGWPVSLGEIVRWPAEMVRLAWRTLPILPDWLLRLARGDAMPLPFTAPRLSFNRPITDRRAVAFAGMPLADVRRVKNAFGCTVNDVVQAAVAGALREHLAAQGELPAEPLIAMVPVAVRDGRPALGTNRVTGMFSVLPTQLTDPAARLRAVAHANRVAKRQHQGIDPYMLYDWARLWVSGALAAVSSVYGRLGMADWHPVVYNVLVSNVAGPPLPLYLVGHRIVGLYPFGPVFHGMGLNITVVSYAGEVYVGVLACRDLVPSPSEVADRIPEALAELTKACP